MLGLGVVNQHSYNMSSHGWTAISITYTPRNKSASGSTASVVFMDFKLLDDGGGQITTDRSGSYHSES